MATEHRRAPLRPDLWWRAFTGFYRPKGDTIAALDPVARFLYSARSVILVISAQAAAIAGLMASVEHRFDPLNFALVLIGFVVAHAISNLSNDYFGWRRGHDTADSPRLRYTVHPLAAGVDASTLLTGLAVLALVGAAITGYFFWLRGPGALAFAAAGLLLLAAYDASPITLKSIGLGEIAAFVVWGPLMVGGGEYVITGHPSANAVLASIPYGLGVMSILVGKHIDQADFDITHGQRTLPVVLGNHVSRVLNRAAVAGMYITVAALIAIGRLTPWTALIALAVPRAVRALRVMSAPRPAEAPAGYVGWPLWYHGVCLVHNRAFGWLYILGLVGGAIAATVHS
ncbi:MAG: prenyltransferase [Candidatus Dormibacteraeota bacterium]|nr:prenyltransferase [Candidatus Dormibacteraeota bacterium]